MTDPLPPATGWKFEMPSNIKPFLLPGGSYTSLASNMLPSRITAHDDNESASLEDIFSSAITTIFPDDTINAHGTPGSYLIYRSLSLGQLRLRVPQYPNKEEGRQLFAHHLWNAAVLAAEAIERASLLSDGNKSSHAIINSSTNKGQEASSIDSSSNLTWNQQFWDVRDKRILELGAGTALPSIVSALCNAASVNITDHPSSSALTTGTIKENVKANLIRSNASPSSRHVCPAVSIQGYTWGSASLPEEPSVCCVCSSSNSIPSSPAQEFDRIIIADCLWMPSQHINLIKTVLHFLPAPSTYHWNNTGDQREDNGNGTLDSESSQHTPCALVVAGFHSGRRIVANFISLATNPNHNATNSPKDPLWQPLDSETNPPSHDSGAACSLENAATTTTITTTTGVPNTALPALSEDELARVGKLELADIFEVDVNLNTRPWSPEREGETKWEAKRWCMVAVLVRR